MNAAAGGNSGSPDILAQAVAVVREAELHYNWQQRYHRMNRVERVMIHAVDLLPGFASWLVVAGGILLGVTMIVISVVLLTWILSI